MADPTDPTNLGLWGAGAAAVVAFFASAARWMNRNRIESSASRTEQAYNEAAERIVERLEREIKGLAARLDVAERQRDECDSRYRRMQGVMLKMATSMLAVRGLEELGHTVIDNLQAGDWPESGPAPL